MLKKLLMQCKCDFLVTEKAKEFGQLLMVLTSANQW